VSSRQEEKERRRKERQERERAEARAAARKKRLQFAFAGLLTAAAVGAVVVFVIVGVGGGGDGGGDGEPIDPPDTASVQLPVQQLGDVEEAAKAAGCKLTDTTVESASHEDKEFQPSDYEQNPPMGANHNPVWYQDGIYEPGSVPRLGMLVHTLEHGRINIQYKPGTPAETVRRLEALFNEMESGYHLLLYENTTGMEAAVAATAWEHQLTCPEMNDKVFDAIRTFREAYIDQGPEDVP
jgi:Protein of unknown function (DUF3105)